MFNSFSMIPSTAFLRQTARFIPIVAAALALPAADASAYSASVRKSCRSDYFKFCSAFEENSPQLTKCMTQAGKRGGLEPRCLSALADAGLAPKKYRTK